MPDNRYYFINNDAKIVRHFSDMPEETPEGFEYCGMSQLPVKGAAGYYAKNQSGFSIEDGDKKESPNETNDIPKA